MTDFRPIFIHLGLEQYIQTFEQEGFEDWETIWEITESDLDALKVKLGHRRILQREIALCRGTKGPKPNAAQAYLDLGPNPEARQQRGAEDQDVLPIETGQIPRKKRRYRRHPKPDDNAPERPPSAYVVFSNKVREDSKSDNLSFTDMAKRVGESWQALASEEKALYERQASNAKQEYSRQMAAYKTTDNYREYQTYLADFKAKHGSHEARSKLEHEQSTASSASGNEGDPRHFSDPFHSETPGSAGASLSRPSSMSTSLRANDPSLSLSPPARSGTGHLTAPPWTSPTDAGHERSAGKTGQPALLPNSSWRHSSSPNIPTAAVHNPHLPQPRRKPPGISDTIPSFRHEGSSRSSITSSQSSISTAATSLSSIRGPEEDVKQKVTLPPLSTVTGMAREPPVMEHRSMSIDDFPPASRGMSPYGGAHTPRSEQHLTDGSSRERTPRTSAETHAISGEPLAGNLPNRHQRDGSDAIRLPEGSGSRTPLGRSDGLSLLAHVAHRDRDRDRR